MEGAGRARSPGVLRHVGRPSPGPRTHRRPGVPQQHTPRRRGRGRALPRHSLSRRQFASALARIPGCSPPRRVGRRRAPRRLKRDPTATTDSQVEYSHDDCDSSDLHVSVLQGPGRRDWGHGDFLCEPGNEILVERKLNMRSAAPGDAVSCNLWWSELGRSASSSVVAEDPLPGGVEPFVKAEDLWVGVSCTPQGGCTVKGGRAQRLARHGMRVGLVLILLKPTNVVRQGHIPDIR